MDSVLTSNLHKPEVVSSIRLTLQASDPLQKIVLRALAKEILKTHWSSIYYLTVMSIFLRWPTTDETCKFCCSDGKLLLPLSCGLLLAHFS